MNIFILINPNKITNVKSDRDMMLLWLGDKSPTTQVNYHSTFEKFLQLIDQLLIDVKLEYL